MSRLPPEPIHEPDDVTLEIEPDAGSVSLCLYAGDSDEGDLIRFLPEEAREIGMQLIEAAMMADLLQAQADQRRVCQRVSSSHLN